MRLKKRRRKKSPCWVVLKRSAEVHSVVGLGSGAVHITGPGLTIFGKIRVVSLTNRRPKGLVGIRDSNFLTDRVRPLDMI